MQADMPSAPSFIHSVPTDHRNLTAPGPLHMQVMLPRSCLPAHHVLVSSDPLFLSSISTFSSERPSVPVCSAQPPPANAVYVVTCSLLQSYHHHQKLPELCLILSVSVPHWTVAPGGQRSGSCQSQQHPQGRALVGA
jgi:hypothetical protein